MGQVPSLFLEEPREGELYRPNSTAKVSPSWNHGSDDSTQGPLGQGHPCQGTPVWLRLRAESQGRLPPPESPRSTSGWKEEAGGLGWGTGLEPCVSSCEYIITMIVVTTMMGNDSYL